MKHESTNEPVAWRETYGKIIKALAAIVNVHTPDELFDLDAIPRDPVMGFVTQIKHAIDGYKPSTQDQRKDDALRLALEIVKDCRCDPRLKYEHPACDKAITLIEQALENK